MQRAEDEALYGGSKGGGKSDAILFESTRQINHPQYKALLLRRSFPKLLELIERSRQVFPYMGGKYNEANKIWRFQSGAFIRFGHCQYERDKDNYQGHEYSFIGFDQLEEFTESMYTYILGANRTSDAGIRCYIRASANPGGVGHNWVKQRFIKGKIPFKTYAHSYNLPNGGTIDRTSTFIPARVYDNAILLKNNPQYLAILMQMPDKLRRAMLEGDWDVFEGQYFSEFDTEIHVIKPFKIPKEWTRFRCGDYGFSKPSAVYWVAVSPEGVLYVYRELYEAGLLYSQLAKKIVVLTPEDENIEYTVMDSSIWTPSNHTGEHGAETMGNYGVDCIQADKSRVVGWGRLREYLRLRSGKPSIYFFETCENAVETIQSLVHSDSDPEDLNSDGEDHAADAIRYGVMSRPPLPEIEAPHVLKTYDQRVVDWTKKRRAKIARAAKRGPVDSTLGDTW